MRVGAVGPPIKPLGIGTWAWGDRMYWGYGREDFTDEDLKQSFDAAIEAGVGFFDSAEVYGNGRSEKVLGGFIQGAATPLVAATKFMPFPWRLRKKSLLNSLRASLERLGIARLDLYQIHYPLPPISIETWMEAMAEAVEAGLVRYVGVSNFNLEQTQRAHEALAKRGVPLASNQVEYHLLEDGPETSGLLQWCLDVDILLIAYSPLAQGLLTGKYTPDNPPPGARRLRANRRKLSRAVYLVEFMREIGQAHGGKSPAQVALNWLICKGTLPIPGVKTLAQTRENLGALGWRLTQDEVAALDAERRLSPG